MSRAQPLDGDPAARVLVAGASGLRRRARRRARLAPPAARAGRGRPRAATPARGSTASTRATACRSSSTSSTSTRLEEVDAAIVAYPHGASAPVVAALRGLGVQVVDLSADFRLRDLPIYERGTGRTASPSCSRTPSTACTELHRERSARPSWSPTRAAIRPRALLALAPLAEAGSDRRRRRSTPSRASPAPAAAAARRDALVIDGPRTPTPYRVDGHRHAPEIAQELGGARQRAAPVTFVPHLLPLDQGELASCYVAARRAGSTPGASQALYRERYADEPFVEVVDGPPGVRDVRDTNLCRVYVTVEERRAGRSPSPRSTTSGRGPPARRSRT